MKMTNGLSFYSAMFPDRAPECEIHRLPQKPPQRRDDLKRHELFVKIMLATGGKRVIVNLPTVRAFE